MDISRLIEKYQNVPKELKDLKRWVCFKIETVENGRKTKRPYNALSGNFAKVNNELTWTTFNTAINGCVKFNCDGLGFVLGNGIVGIDLDRHDEDTQTQEEFDVIAKEFIDTLDSYTEFSQSGNGIHIICKGKLPEGSRRKGNVEMYDENRFFAFTGNIIKQEPIKEKQEQIVSLWEKYVKTIQQTPIIERKYINLPTLQLSDDDVIQTAINSSQGGMFYAYYKNGDISINGNDHSASDLAFCNMLAFWTNKDKLQMDRIFRNSGLMRDKWDEYRGTKTYGEITLDKAISNVVNGYVKIDTTKETFSIKDKTVPALKQDESKSTMSLDENGEPIFHIKKIFKRYGYNDTGNARRFYDYFGDLFRYNVTDKKYMFWTGKVWVKDEKKIIRKYANKLIEILKEEEKQIREEIAEKKQNGQNEEAMALVDVLKACEKNTTRISNKAGKDAMLDELTSLYDIPMESSDFNKDDFLLNTDTGTVDLRTGTIIPFDKNEYITKITSCAVSYEEPTEWLKFLTSVFNTGNSIQTQEIVDYLQLCLGYSLSGSTQEQKMFFLYGAGANGKSTLVETIMNIIGEYADNIASNVLMQSKNTNNSAMYSIAKLQKTRFVGTGETEENGRFAEAQVKSLTGGDTISAQFKYGNEFSFKPKFKIWLSSNNKPIIDNNFAIKRRIVFFPFKNIFTGDKKDITLPEKLKAENDKILGWLINGFLKYQDIGSLEKTMPKVLLRELDDYVKEFDAIGNFIEDECDTTNERYSINCNQLFEKFKIWAMDNSEKYYPQKRRFKSELVKKGFSLQRDEHGREYFKGIKLIGDFSLAR